MESIGIRPIGPLVFFAGGETAADSHFEFGVKFMFFVERADDLFRIQHFVALHDLDVMGGDFAFLIDGERKLARLVIGGLEFNPLEVENDIGDVLHHSGQSGEFMLRACDFDRGNGGPFERRK